MMVERERAWSFAKPGRVKVMVRKGCLCNSKDFQVAILQSSDRFPKVDRPDREHTIRTGWAELAQAWLPGTAAKSEHLMRPVLMPDEVAMVVIEVQDARIGSQRRRLKPY